MKKPSGKRLTALIVDDNRDKRELYTYFLSAAGVNTVEAEDGIHGFAKATTILPDVIATDLSLLRMSGLQMCHTLKQHEQTRQIPVIAIAESEADRDVDKAKKAGCVSVLVQPCSPETLLAEIERVLALPRFASKRTPSSTTSTD